jgi:putative zinc finger protein
VSDFTCAQVNEAAAEFALGILPPDERESVEAHLQRCPACRLEVESMQSVGTQLLDLVPGTEPPLGFDRRVLSRVKPAPSPMRRRYRMIATLAAAAAIAVATTIGVDASHTSRPTPAVAATAVLYEGKQPVGQVAVYPGHPTWVGVTVQLASAGTDSSVKCEMVGYGGSVTDLGSFRLSAGRGSWFARYPKATSRLAGIRLLDDKGDVVASAQFS